MLRREQEDERPCLRPTKERERSSERGQQKNLSDQCELVNAPQPAVKQNPDHGISRRVVIGVAALLMVWLFSYLLG